MSLYKFFCSSTTSLRNITAVEIRDLVFKHGGIYFQDLNIQIDDFISLSSLCGNSLEVRDVSKSLKELGYHTEDGYNPFRPDAIWFYCISKGSDGGTPTWICDGIELYNALPTGLIQSICNVDIIYERQWSKHVWEDALGNPSRKDMQNCIQEMHNMTIDFLKNGDLYLSYKTPLISSCQSGQKVFANSLMQALTRPHIYGAKLSDNNISIAELNHAVYKAAENIEYPIEWQPGQIAVLDNTRFMHRRKTYLGKNRIIKARHSEGFFSNLNTQSPSPLFLNLKDLIQFNIGDVVRTGKIPDELMIRN